MAVPDVETTKEKEPKGWPINLCFRSLPRGGPHRAFLPGCRPTLKELGIKAPRWFQTAGLRRLKIPTVGPGLELGSPDGIIVVECLLCQKRFQATLPWGLRK